MPFFFIGEFLGHPLTWSITHTRTSSHGPSHCVTPPSRNSVYHCVANSTLLTTRSTPLLLKLKKVPFFFIGEFLGHPLTWLITLCSPSSQGSSHCVTPPSLHSVYHCVVTLLKSKKHQI